MNYFLLLFSLFPSITNKIILSASSVYISHTSLLPLFLHPISTLQFLSIKYSHEKIAANLAVSRDTHQELFDVGAVATLVNKCDASVTDIETRRALAFGFNNVGSNPANHTACERLGVIRKICDLLKDLDKDTNLQATIALRRLCESARCRNQTTEMGGIPSLLKLGKIDR